MVKMNRDESKVVVTREGRMYIKTSDHFRSDKVKSSVLALKRSSLVESIASRKSEDTKQKN